MEASPKALAAQNEKVPATIVSKKTLYKGYKNYTIALKNKLNNAVVTYKSSDKLVATVSAKGVVKPVNKGRAVITVNISQAGRKYTSKIDITVMHPYFELINETNEVMLGSTFTFKGKGYGMGKDDWEWRSSDDSIVTIEKNPVY